MRTMRRVEASELINEISVYGVGAWGCIIEKMESFSVKRFVFFALG